MGSYSPSSRFLGREDERMVEIPHIVGHAAISNPNQATRLQLYWAALLLLLLLLLPVMGRVTTM